MDSIDGNLASTTTVASFDFFPQIKNERDNEKRTVLDLSFVENYSNYSWHIVCMKTKTINHTLKHTHALKYTFMFYVYSVYI